VASAGIDRSVTEKMEARARRFNLDEKGIVRFDEIVKLYDQ
jgi:hypothetical protein